MGRNQKVGEDDLDINLLCKFAKLNDIEGMKAYINKFADKEDAKKKHKNNFEMTYPFNLALNYHNYICAI